MKNLSAFVFINIFHIICFANVKVEYDLKFQRQSWLRYSYTSGGFFGIGEKEKIYDTRVQWYVPFKKNHEDIGRYLDKLIVFGTSYDNQGLYFKPSCRYPDDYNKSDCFLYIKSMQPLPPDDFFNPFSFNGRGYSRESDVTTEITENKTKIEINDYLYSDKVIGGRFFRFSDDQITGSVKIYPPRSENQTFVFMKKTEASGLFNVADVSDLITLGGSSFKSTIDQNTRNRWETIWTLPGSIPYIQYTFGKNDKGIGFGIENDKWVNIGRLDIEFAVNVFDFSYDSFENYFEELNRLSNDQEILNTNSLLLRNMLFSLLSNNLKIDELLRTASISQLDDYLKILNIITTRNYLEPKENVDFSYVGWDIKAASQILAIDISRRSLSRLDSFCSQVDYIDNKGETHKVSGIILASFFAGRAISRLENFQFNDFEKLFIYMEKLNKESVTYAQVRADSDSVQRLRDAVEILRNSGVLKNSAFDIAADELTYLMNTFGNLKGSDTDLSKVVESISIINLEIEESRKKMMERLRTFQPDNDEIVNFSDIQNEVQNIAYKISKMQSDLQNVFGFESFTSSGLASAESREKFISYLVNVLTNYLSVFDLIAGDLSIDRYLNAYKEHYKIDEVRKNYNKCLIL